MFFGADYSQQHCPLWSAALPTIVGTKKCAVVFSLFCLLVRIYDIKQY